MAEGSVNDSSPSSHNVIDRVEATYAKMNENEGQNGSVSESQKDTSSPPSTSSSSSTNIGNTNNTPSSEGAPPVPSLSHSFFSGRHVLAVDVPRRKGDTKKSSSSTSPDTTPNRDNTSNDTTSATHQQDNNQRDMDKRQHNNDSTPGKQQQQRYTMNADNPLSASNGTASGTTGTAPASHSQTPPHHQASPQQRQTPRQGEASNNPSQSPSKYGSETEFYNTLKLMLKNIDMSWILCDLIQSPTVDTPNERMRVEQLMNKKLNDWLTYVQPILPYYCKTLSELFPTVSTGAQYHAIYTIWHRIRYLHGSMSWYYGCYLQQQPNNKSSAPVTSPSNSVVVKLDSSLLQRSNSLMFLTVTMFLSRIVKLPSLIYSSSTLQPYAYITDILSLLEFCRLNFSGYSTLIDVILSLGAHTAKQHRFVDVVVQATNPPPTASNNDAGTAQTATSNIDPAASLVSPPSSSGSDARSSSPTQHRNQHSDSHRLIGPLERRRMEQEQLISHIQLYNAAVADFAVKAKEFVNNYIGNFLMQPNEISDRFPDPDKLRADLEIQVNADTKIFPYAFQHLNIGVQAPYSEEKELQQRSTHQPTYKHYTHHHNNQIPFLQPAPTSLFLKYANIVTMSRDFFLLGLLREWCVNASPDNICQFTLPFGVHYISASIKSINKRAHSLACTSMNLLNKHIIYATAPDAGPLTHTSQLHVYGDIVHQFIPYYVKTALANYPDIIEFSPLTEIYVMTFNIIHHDSPMLLYFMRLLIDKCKEMISKLPAVTDRSSKVKRRQRSIRFKVRITPQPPAKGDSNIAPPARNADHRNNPQNNNTNRSPSNLPPLPSLPPRASSSSSEATEQQQQQRPATRGIAGASQPATITVQTSPASSSIEDELHPLPNIRPLIILTLQLIQLLNIQLVDASLSMVKELFTTNQTGNVDIPISIAHTIHAVISRNYDLYKRDILVDWYMRVLDEYNIYPPVVQ